MKVRYAPEGAEPREWDFSPTRLLNVEAEAIERYTGMPYGEWAKAIMHGSMTALHGLLYVLLKRSTPTLKYDDVVFCLEDLDFVVDDAEARDIYRALRRKQEAGDPLAPEEQATLDRLADQGMTDDADPFESPAG